MAWTFIQQPRGRYCRRCKTIFLPPAKWKGSTCPACKTELATPIPCATCGDLFVKVKSAQKNCHNCATKKPRRCKMCRVQLSYEIETKRRGYCDRCAPPDLFCCICGTKIEQGFRCDTCQRFTRVKTDEGLRHSDFNPQTSNTFAFTEEENAYRRQLRLERLKIVWKERGWI